MQCGEICRHERFYRDQQTGEMRPKYLVILTCPEGRDVIARLLTSRAHGRPERPECFHGNPYPGYYLGVLGKPLTAKSWVDLRFLEDMDAVAFQRRRSKGTLSLITQLPDPIRVGLLECVAGAEDTTRAQENALRNELQTQRQGLRSR